MTSNVRPHSATSEKLVASFEELLGRRFGRFSEEIVANMQGKELYSVKVIFEILQKFGDDWKLRILNSEPEERLAPKFLALKPVPKEFREQEVDILFLAIAGEFKSKGESDHFKIMAEAFQLINYKNLKIVKESKNDIEWLEAVLNQDREIMLKIYIYRPDTRQNSMMAVIELLKNRNHRFPDAKVLKGISCTVSFYEEADRAHLKERKFVLDIEVCASCKQYATTEIKLKKCSKCLSTFYCSGECQKKDWAAHKIVCKSPSTGQT